MEVTVRVVLADPAARPAPGTPVRVEVRDVTEQDAASVRLAGADAVTVEGDGDDPVVTVTLEVPTPDPGRDVVLWARVAVSGAERTTAGDLLSTRAVALRPVVLPGGEGTEPVDLPVVAI